MASTKKPKSVALKIKGVARYPKLHAPYVYVKADNKSVIDWEKGKFQLEVAMTEAEAAPFISAIKDAAVEGGLDLDDVKNWPYKVEKDKETKKKTGNIIFKATQYGSSKDGKKRKIALFDAKAKGLPGDFRVTGGSIVNMAVRTNVFEQLGGGVNLYLDGVQILKYVPYEGANPGFAAEEEGDFEYEGDSESNGFADETEDNAEASAQATDPTHF
jgi:hypothetical protein